MTPFEITLSLSSMAACAMSVIYVFHLVKVSGRDRLHNASRVAAFVQNAPYDRLGNVLSK